MGQRICFVLQAVLCLQTALECTTVTSHALPLTSSTAVAAAGLAGSRVVSGLWYISCHLSTMSLWPTLTWHNWDLDSQ